MDAGAATHDGDCPVVTRAASNRGEASGSETAERASGRRSTVVAATGISRLAQITGVTMRALRHYEARGILSPIRSRSGARYFTPHQVDIAVLVVLLRRLDTPLPEVAAIVATSPSDTALKHGLRSLFDARADDLSRLLQDVRRAVATCDA